MSDIAIVLVLLIMIVLQVFLSMHKNKWLGIIIPIINTIVAIIYALNANSFAMLLFKVMSIPTLINIVIYIACRTKLKEKKMQIDDLE